METDLSEYEVSTPATPDGGRPVPAVIRMVGSPRPATGNEIRAVEAMTGRSWSELSEHMADATQAMTWLALRRQGYTATWEQAGDVYVEMVEEDPTSGGGSMSSSPSAGSGGSPPGT